MKKKVIAGILVIFLIALIKKMSAEELKKAIQELEQELKERKQVS